MSFRNILYSTSAIVAVAGLSSTAQAATTTLSAAFDKGAIAEYSNGANQTSNAKLFAELGISRITISQSSDNGSWGGSQGNDVNVNVTLTKTNGSTVTFAGSVNWVQKTGPNPDWIGLTISPTTNVNDGYTLSGATQKTYMLEFSRSTQLETIYAASGKDALDGSADTRGALGALNALALTDAVNPLITGPSGGAGSATSAISVYENQTGVTQFRADETVAWSLASGTDLSKFQINATTGVLTFIGAPDYETPQDGDTNNTYVVTVQARDPSGNISTQTITVTILDIVDENKPVFTGTNSTNAGVPSYSFSYAEGSPTSATLGTISATGGTGARTYRIASGNDALHYTIDASTGALSLTDAGAAAAVNDFEQGGNVQTLTIEVSDSATPANTSEIIVTLNETNVAEGGPAITGPSGGLGAANSAVTVPEEQTGVTRLIANKTVTWAIVGGDDAGKFNIAPDGTITFALAPDYEGPTDTGTNNVYVLTVLARDTDGVGTTQTVTVTVTNIDDTAPQITGPSGGAGAADSAITVPENQTGVTKLTANEPVTWTITGGSEAGKFTIAPGGTITFNTAPDYEAPTDSDGNNTYVLIVQARDRDGNISVQTITVTVANVDDTAPIITGPGGKPGDAASAISVPEGQTDVTQLLANETVAWTIAGGPDAAKLAIAADGKISFLAAPDFENATDADRNNTYVIQVMARDPAGNSSLQTVTITVTDVNEVAQKLAAISGKLRGDLRNYAFASLHDMLSFNEGLMQGADEAGNCSAAQQRKDLSGKLQANQQAQNVDLQYRKQVNACEAKVRVFLDLGLSSSSTNGNANLRTHGAIRAETALRPGVTLGLGVLGSTSSDSLRNFADSSISDKSLQGNLYLRARLNETLRAGAFGSIGRAWYNFGLTDAGLVVAGRMTGDRYAYGAMLSGDLKLAGIKVTTDLALSRASEKLDNATLNASYKGEIRNGIAFAVGTVDATRLSVPVHLRLLNQEPRDGLTDSFTLIVSPGLLCEDQSADTSALTCGYQVGGRFNWTATYRDRAYVGARHESVDGNRRDIFSVGYARAFGPIELGMSVDRETAELRGNANRAMVHLKLVSR